MIFVARFKMILNDILFLILLGTKLSHQRNKIYGGIPAIERKIIMSLRNIDNDMDFGFHFKKMLYNSFLDSWPFIVSIQKIDFLEKIESNRDILTKCKPHFIMQCQN